MHSHFILQSNSWNFTWLKNERERKITPPPRKNIYNKALSTFLSKLLYFPRMIKINKTYCNWCKHGYNYKKTDIILIACWVSSNFVSSFIPAKCRYFSSFLYRNHVRSLQTNGVLWNSNTKYGHNKPIIKMIKIS